MAKTMRVGWVGSTALATVVALALVQVPALAQTSPAPSAAAPEAAAESAPAAAPAAEASGPLDPFAHGTAQAGSTKAAICSSCHGPSGNSANPDWPRLAGQSAVYIAEQLRLFKAGVRNNPIMKPLANTLSDQDISDLAVYYQAQTVTGLEADPSYWKAGPSCIAAVTKRGTFPPALPATVL